MKAWWRKSEGMGIGFAYCIYGISLKTLQGARGEEGRKGRRM
jgi:hypothetical protein